MSDFEMSNEMMYLIKAIFALGIATILSMLVRRAIRHTIDKRWEDGNEDVTRLKFLRNSISAIFYALAIAYIFYEIPALNNLGKALFAGAGVLAAVIGFASQKAFSNIISGVFILLFRPFKVGDAVTVSSRSGIIEDITLRHTVIRDYENRRVIIPNSVISDETIVNSDITDETIRQQIYFGISYESDIGRAMQCIKEVAMDHPFTLDRRTEEEIANGIHPVMVRVLSWDDSSISIRAQVWTASIDEGFVVKCDMLKSVKERFEQEGIEIPYPHRTLVMKNALEHSILDGNN
ncbi:MAG: mechanosensitive ion channel family protein [Flavobacteriales bacterium]|nr:mechanosensitive ion channel family protein [Flavobacteriales bacterium]NNK81328.1 mechanosensitive ion channel family protein [Flavobacteriales bacterium]